jgi:diacylglycerol kinase
MAGDKGKSVVLKALHSFRYAFSGTVSLVRNENNVTVHLTIALLVIVTGCFLALSNLEWCLLIVQIGFVLTAEAFNTSIEKLADRVSPAIDPAIKLVKDIAAGAVLISAVTAAIVGILILGPKLLNLLL